MTHKMKQDNVLTGVDTALKRAAKRAREIAERTHTPLVTYKDGHVQKRMVVRESHSPDSGTYSEIR